MTPDRSPVAAMLDARSIAIVGASARPGSFGARMVTEVGRGDRGRTVVLINPRYDDIDGVPCLASLKELAEPVDLVLLGVGDRALAEQLAEAARIGARAAVIYANAHGDALRTSLTGIARDADMALCGAGCMGFVNVAAGVRALGYLERDPIRPGPVSLVTHSGSVFSALLRTRRALGYTVAVSSGQELVTTTADYLEYLLEHTATQLIVLVLETVRDGPRLRAALHLAATRNMPVVILAVGGSPLGGALVTAHSGAVAGADAMWEALCADTGALRVRDLGELTDTVELLSLVRRPRWAGSATGIATVHDSGAQRSLVADLADELDVPFAVISAQTRTAIEALLDEGLAVANPLDVWGSGADTRALFGGCLRAMADDPNVAVAALAVDLVEEYDGDTSYADAVLDVATATETPVVVLANLASAIDGATASRLRDAGVPVLEGTRSGLVAMRHLLAAHLAAPVQPMVDTERQARWRARLVSPLEAVESFEVLRDYGIATAAVRAVASEADALAAAAALGYPVVLKTDEPSIAHKSDVGGVVLGLADDAAMLTAYRDLAVRLGPRVLVSVTVPAGVEVSIGLVRDPQLGPLVVVGAGGLFIELLADRRVALPPISPGQARNLVDGLRVRALLEGWRGAPAADVDALVRAIVGMSQLAIELGDLLDALDVNPLFVSPSGAVAVDVLVVGRRPFGWSATGRPDRADNEERAFTTDSP